MGNAARPAWTSFGGVGALVLSGLLVTGPAERASSAGVVSIKLSYGETKGFSLYVNDHEGVGGMRVKVDKDRSVDFSVAANTLLYTVGVKAEEKTITTGYEDAIEAFLQAAGGVPTPVQSAVDAAKGSTRGSAEAGSPEDLIRKYVDAADAVNEAAKLADTLKGMTKAASSADGIGKLKTQARTAVTNTLGPLPQPDPSPEDITKAGQALIDSEGTAWRAVPPRDEKWSDLTKTAYDNAKSLHDQIVANKEALVDAFKKAGALYKLISEAKFCTDPLLWLADEHKEIDYVVKLTPTELAGSGVSAHSATVRVVCPGGWEIDASTGFVITRLVDRKYHIQQVPDPSTPDPDDTKPWPVRLTNAEDDFRTAPVVLLHVYPNTDWKVKLGASFGLATSDAKRIVYMAGPSLFFGGDRRFVFTAGIAGGPVSSLNYAAPIVNDQPNLTDVTRWSWFATFTYNLGSLTP